MPKGKKTKIGIYHPPKSGMPYLVVTVSPEGVTATACNSKDEAEESSRQQERRRLPCRTQQMLTLQKVLTMDEARGS